MPKISFPPSPVLLPLTQGVKEGVEAFVGRLFRPENSPEPLGLLSSGPELGRNLNDDVRFGQVDGGVAHAREEDGVDPTADPKRGQQSLPVAFLGPSINRVPPEELRIFGKGIDAVREDDDLIACPRRRREGRREGGGEGGREGEGDDGSGRKGNEGAKDGCRGPRR